MHGIDRYAYTNNIRWLDPAQKGGLAALALALCLALPSPLVGLAALGWMAALATLWAGVPARAVARAMLAEALFLALSVAGVALSVALDAPGLPWQWRVGPLWLATSPQALHLAALLLARALGCAAAMSFLALTTPLVDLIDLLRRLRVPDLLIDLMTLIYRFIFILLESMERMRTAQESRAGYRGFWGGMRDAGLLGSRLFIDAYARSRRLDLALQSRGHAGGPLAVLPADYRRSAQPAWLMAALAASLLLAWRLG
ncbi:cobalt ECF transporter T component CbiQ [Chloroflexia bacterium SDU3-3]|nr:cobalt ECF transporter T component CbiQ [Chloroflexia bacterium SDU3-3]